MSPPRAAVPALIGLLAGIGAAPAGAQITCDWTAVTDLAVSSTGMTNGVAWIDFDGDDDLDLYFTKSMGTGSSASRLLRNNGDGTFTLLSTSALSTVTNDRQSTWADYDNDGDPDCFVVCAAPPNHLFRNDGGGAFREVTTSVLNAAAGGGCGWADYDLDGDVDLYVGNSLTAPNALFRNDGGTFTDVTAPPIDVIGPTQGIAWGDYDNDRDPDLYVTNNGGQNHLFRNDGGWFTDVSAPPVDDAGAGHGTAWADYDNDGWLDLYVVNINSPNKLFHNRHDGTFSDASVYPVNGIGLNSACAWGDYDNDGYLDLYFDRAFSANTLAHNDLIYGELHFTDATSGPLVHFPLGGGLAWGDYDGDGDVDMAIATLQDDQPNVLIRNDCAPVSNWLQVDLEGVMSNRSGVGAKLRAVEAGRSQYRWIETSSGFLAQSSMVAQFGFGLANKTDSVIDSLVVVWPSGTVQVVIGIPVDQHIHLKEDSTTVGLVASGFRAVTSPGTVDLEWLASFDHRDDGFLVLRAPSRAGPWRQLNAEPVRGSNPLRWSDREVEPLATYFYRLETDTGDGDADAVLRVTLPFWGARTVLEPNRPNPFLAGTELAFSLAAPGFAELAVYDVAGRRLATVASGRFPGGRQVVRWDGRDDRGRRLPAGVYFYRLDSAGITEARRLVLLGR